MKRGAKVRALNKELIAQYDLNIKKYQYIRSNYYLETNRGSFLLRKIDIPKDQIFFDYEVDTQLSQHGFENINKIVTTRKKAPFALQGDQVYILQKYTECDETDFQYEKDLLHTIWILSNFHKAATFIESKVRDVDTMHFRNLYELYMKRASQNIKLKKSISEMKQKSLFEILFLKHSEEYMALEQLALAGMDKNLGERLNQKVKEKRTVAHRDYTYHTVNKTAEDIYIMSNLDNCNYDIQMVDLANILGRIMQKNNWDIEILYNLIRTYDQYNPLSKEDFRILKAMLIYPEKYNSICSSYISSRRRWNYSMFEQKWQNMMLYKENEIKAVKIIQSW